MIKKYKLNTKIKLCHKISNKVLPHSSKIVGYCAMCGNGVSNDESIKQDWTTEGLCYYCSSKLNGEKRQKQYSDEKHREYKLLSDISELTKKQGMKIITSGHKKFEVTRIK